MIGAAKEWYTIVNTEGHELALSQGENWFATEDLAAITAQEVCKEYKRMVLVKKNVTKYVRAFKAQVTPVEVKDTSAVAS